MLYIVPVWCHGAYLLTVPVIACTHSCSPRPFGLFWALNKQVISRFTGTSWNHYWVHTEFRPHSALSFSVSRKGSETPSLCYSYFNWHFTRFKFRSSWYFKHCFSCEMCAQLSVHSTSGILLAPSNTFLCESLTIALRSRVGTMIYSFQTHILLTADFLKLFSVH